MIFGRQLLFLERFSFVCLACYGIGESGLICLLRGPRMVAKTALKWIPFETQNLSKYRPTSNLGHKPKAKLQGFCRAEAIQNQNSWFHLGFTLSVAQLFLGDFCHAKNVGTANTLAISPKGEVS